MIDPMGVNYVYGSDRMIQITVNALTEAEYLKTMKAKLIKDALQKVDIRGLVESSPAKALSHEEIISVTGK